MRKTARCRCRQVAEETGRVAETPRQNPGMPDGTGEGFLRPDEITVIVNKLPVTLKGKSNYVFVDVFSFIDFDLNDSRGRSIVTQLNKRRAEYMEPLTEGDVIDIYWEEDKR